MPPKNQTEKDMVADAPIVNEASPEVTRTPEQELEDKVQSIVTGQFGGEDGEPQEGVAKWGDFEREQVMEADALEVAYRDILARKEANRTLLRALTTSRKIPPEIAQYYYRPRERKSKAS